MRLHRTKDEIDFINQLGTFRRKNWGSPEKRKTNTKERIILLENYLKTMDNRSDWEGIEKDVVAGYVKNLIAQLKES